MVQKIFPDLKKVIQNNIHDGGLKMPNIFAKEKATTTPSHQVALCWEQPARAQRLGACWQTQEILSRERVAAPPAAIL